MYWVAAVQRRAGIKIRFPILRMRTINPEETVRQATGPAALAGHDSKMKVPRGVTVLAGGTVEPDATSFQISADAGSDTYGICSNKFLDREFKTVRYELTVTLHGPDSFSYHEDTQLKMKGRNDLFHHTDSNRVTRVK